MRFTTVLPLLLVPLLILGCGSGDEPTTLGSGPAKIKLAETDADLGKLIPADASVVLYMASPDGVARKMLDMARIVTPDEVEGITDEQAFEMMASESEMPPFILNNIDKTKPMAVAMTMTKRRGEPRPIMSIIMGVTDVENARAEIRGETRSEPPFLGSFVRIDQGPNMPGASDSVPDIAKGLPEGDLVARVDLDRIVKLFGSDMREGIESAKAEMKRQMPAEQSGSMEIANTLLDWVGDLIDSAEQLDVIARMDGKTMSIEALFTAKEGSALGSAPAPSGKLAEVAGCLPDGFPVTVMGIFSFQDYMEFIEPAMGQMTAAMPEEARASFESYMDKSREAMKHLGDEMAAAIDFGEEGLRMVFVMSASDADAYLAKSAEMLEGVDTLSAAGMEFFAEPVREVAGCTVHTWRMKFDFSKFMPPGGRDAEQAAEAAKKIMDTMFGPDGMTFHGASAGGKVVMAIGGDEADLTAALEAAKSGGKPSGALGDAFERAGGAPKFLLQADLRALARQWIGIARSVTPPNLDFEAPDLSDGDAAPLNLYFSSEGRHYLFGADLDMKGFMALLMELMRGV